MLCFILQIQCGHPSTHSLVLKVAGVHYKSFASLYLYAGSTEVKHKLYGSVLIIGGGLAFPGAAAMLQSRLELQLPVLFNRSSQTVEVFSNPRVSVLE